MQEQVKITIKSEEEKVFKAFATYEKDIIYFVEDETDKTVTIFDKKNKVLKRDNNKIYIEIYFDTNKPTKSKIEIKELNEYLELDVITNDIIISDNMVYINYELNDMEYTFKIEKDGDNNEYN